MFNKYNIYHQILRAAAGDPPGGNDDNGGNQDDPASSSNAKTINESDPEDLPVAAKTEGGDGEQGDPDPASADADGGEQGDPPARKPVTVPRDAMLRRVGELTKDKKDLKDENERLKAELAAKGESGEGDGPQRTEFKTQAEFDTAVAKEAQRVAAENIATAEFNNRCNAVADAGETEFKADWNESVANLRMLSDDGNIPKLLLDAALEADNPAAALHHLGQNPEEALRIMKLPAIKQVAEVVKHGAKKAAVVPKPRSNAPDPIDPLNGGGSKGANDGLSDDVDDETWLANRQAQEDARRLEEYNRTRRS